MSLASAPCASCSSRVAGSPSTARRRPSPGSPPRARARRAGARRRPLPQRARRRLLRPRSGRDPGAERPPALDRPAGVRRLLTRRSGDLGDGGRRRGRARHRARRHERRARRRRRLVGRRTRGAGAGRAPPRPRRSLAVVATPAPDAEVPWIESEQRVELERLGGLLPTRPRRARGAPRRTRPEDPLSPEALWLLGAGPADEAALRTPAPVTAWARCCGRRSSRAHGLAADIAGYCLQPWGFEPETVLAETLLLYGSRDPLADPRHGRWWESRPPNAPRDRPARPSARDPDVGRVLSHLAPDRAPLRLVDGSRRDAEHEDVEEFSAA